MDRQQSLIDIIKRLSPFQMVGVACAVSAAITSSYFVGHVSGVNEVRVANLEQIAAQQLKMGELERSLHKEKERVSRFSEANRRYSGENASLREQVNSLARQLKGQEHGVQDSGASQ